MLYLQLKLSDTAPEQVSQLSLRNSDYPNTHIQSIHISLRSPNHWVSLTWSGPQADSLEVGPFRSSPGTGRGENDCNDATESNRAGSCCTPKGTWKVAGFRDFLPSTPRFRYVTWIHMPRAIAIHSHPNIPNYPASSGCVRLEEHAAKLIHNNSIAGVTQVIVDGTWTRGAARSTTRFSGQSDTME